MARQAHTEPLGATISWMPPPRVNVLQRKCLCGGSAGFTGKCSGCRTSKLLGKTLQAKLRVTELSDAYELEADRVAYQVMRMPDAPVGRDARPNSPISLLHRGVNSNGRAGIGMAPRMVHDVLNSPGQPLDPPTRAFFEPRFGHDFSHVRVHADTKAVESARAVNALAYTVGQHIVLDAGRTQIGSPTGRALLAHELSHSIQQSVVEPNRVLQRATGNEPATKDSEEPMALSPALGATHEIVINGDPYHLVVMSGHPSQGDPAARFVGRAKEYLNDYPNLGNGWWAFIVKPEVTPGDIPYCSIGGNCLGWAYGGTRDVDPSERVWSMVPGYFESIGLTNPVGSTPVGAFINQIEAKTVPPHAVWDYFMSVEFQAVPVDSDTDANLALYGEGFRGSEEGPSHIAFRTSGNEFWVSKPSLTRPPVVHARADQMVGGGMGPELRLYKREAGPLSHITIRPKQAQPTASPQESPHK